MFLGKSIECHSQSLMLHLHECLGLSSLPCLHFQGGRQLNGTFCRWVSTPLPEGPREHSGYIATNWISFLLALKIGSKNVFPSSCVTAKQNNNKKSAPLQCKLLTRYLQGSDLNASEICCRFYCIYLDQGAC